MKSFLDELVEKINQASSSINAISFSISTSLSGLGPGKLTMMTAGRASGKSMNFAMNYGAMGASAPSPPPPMTIVLICDGNVVRATVDDAVTIVVYQGPPNRPSSRKGREVARIPLRAARLFAQEMRRVDVARVELDGRDGEVEVQRRGQGARDANDRSKLRILFRPAEGDAIGVRSTHRRVRKFSSRLEAEVNKVVLDEVMEA